MTYTVYIYGAINYPLIESCPSVLPTITPEHSFSPYLTGSHEEEESVNVLVIHWPSCVIKKCQAVTLRNQILPREREANFRSGAFAGGPTAGASFALFTHNWSLNFLKHRISRVFTNNWSLIFLKHRTAQMALTSRTPITGSSINTIVPRELIVEDPGSPHTYTSMKDYKCDRQCRYGRRSYISGQKLLSLQLYPPFNFNCGLHC